MRPDPVEPTIEVKDDETIERHRTVTEAKGEIDAAFTGAVVRLGGQKLQEVLGMDEAPQAITIESESPRIEDGTKSDPIFESLKNDTYLILGELQDILQKEGVRTKLYHDGQALGMSECLELIDWFQGQEISNPLTIVIKEGQIRIVRNLIGVPSFQDPLQPAKVEFFAVDLADPDSIDKLVEFLIELRKIPRMTN